MTKTQSQVFKTSIGTTVGASNTIPFGSFRSVGIAIPEGSSLTTLSFYVSLNGNWHQARNASNENLSMTVSAGFFYPMPDELFPADEIRIVGNVAQSEVSISGKA